MARYIQKWSKKSNGELRKRNDITIGDYSYGCPNVRMGGGLARLEIGRFCCIAKNVSIHLVSDHHTEWISTYDLGALLNGLGASIDKEKLIYKGDVSIGDNVWIGEGATILPGVTLHNGCVIGAGAVVTHDIPAYCVAAGVPAKVIYKRFDDKNIRILEQIQWWNWDDSLIEKAVDLIESAQIDKLYDYWLQNVKISEVEECNDGLEKPRRRR